MKFYRYLLLVVLMFTTNAYAFKPKIEIIEQFDNLRLIAFLSDKDVENSPQWNPDSGTPSLTVGEAVQAVRNFVKHQAIIKEIKMRPLPNHELHWHYLIKVNDDKMKSGYSVFVVLMSGKVIPAIIEPDSYK